MNSAWKGSVIRRIRALARAETSFRRRVISRNFGSYSRSIDNSLWRDGARIGKAIEVLLFLHLQFARLILSRDGFAKKSLPREVFFRFVDRIEESLLGACVKTVRSERARNLVETIAIAGIDLIEKVASAIDIRFVRQVVEVLVGEDAMALGCGRRK